MSEYVEKEQFNEFIEDIGTMLLAYDVAIEVLASKGCNMEKREFEKLCTEVANRRMKAHDKSKDKKTETIENYSKEE